MVKCQQVVKFVGAEFLAGGIWNIFACSSATRGAMAEWSIQLDSARQIGLETPLTRFLIVVEREITG